LKGVVCDRSRFRATISESCDGDRANYHLGNFGTAEEAALAYARARAAKGATAEEDDDAEEDEGESEEDLGGAAAEAVGEQALADAMLRTREAHGMEIDRSALDALAGTMAPVKPIVTYLGQAQAQIGTGVGVAAGAIVAPTSSLEPQPELPKLRRASSSLSNVSSGTEMQEEEMEVEDIVHTKDGDEILGGALSAGAAACDATVGSPRGTPIGGLLELPNTGGGNALMRAVVSDPALAAATPSKSGAAAPAEPRARDIASQGDACYIRSLPPLTERM